MTTADIALIAAIPAASSILSMILLYLLFRRSERLLAEARKDRPDAGAADDPAARASAAFARMFHVLEDKDAQPTLTELGLVAVAGALALPTMLFLHAERLLAGERARRIGDRGAQVTAATPQETRP